MPKTLPMTADNLAGDLPHICDCLKAVSLAFPDCTWEEAVAMLESARDNPLIRHMLADTLSRLSGPPDVRAAR
jgi:hypothetical protein